MLKSHSGTSLREIAEGTLDKNPEKLEKPVEYIPWDAPAYTQIRRSTQSILFAV